MNLQPVEIDATTAADFKGLFQTIVVRRFKNTVGIRYEMVPSDDVLQFNSYAVLYYIEDNKFIGDFPRTGPISRTGEKFKAKKASQQAAAEIGIQCLDEFVRSLRERIRGDQGESQDYYSSQAGASYAGAPVHLVIKTDWKGQLQTSLLRKSTELLGKGTVEISYTFTQNLSDNFEATLILTHSNPAVGSCRIKGDVLSTKKASEKSAASKAYTLIHNNDLRRVFVPNVDGVNSRTSNGIDDYSNVGKESVKDLKGLFGDNFNAAAPATLATPEESLPVSWSIDAEPDRIVSNISGSAVFAGSLPPESQLPQSRFLSSGTVVDHFKDIDAFPGIQGGPELLPLPSSSKSLQSKEGDLIVANYHGIGTEHPFRSSASSDMFPRFQGDIYPPIATGRSEKDIALEIAKLEMSKVKRNSAIKDVRLAGNYPEDTGFGDSDPYYRSSPSTLAGNMPYEGSNMLRRDIANDPRHSNMMDMTRERSMANSNSMMSGSYNNQMYLQGDPRYDRGHSNTQQKQYGMPPSHTSLPYGGNSRAPNPQAYAQRDPRGYMGPYQIRQPLPLNGPAPSARNEMLQRHEVLRQASLARPYGRSEGSLDEDFMSMRRNTQTLLEPPSASPDHAQFMFDRTFGSQSIRPSQSFDDSASDSKTRMHSFEDEISGLQSEKKLTDWKGELQTFLARNCKDFPFKIEYNSEERVAGGKFVAKVTITFDNKEEENRVIHGIPAVNKKTTERTAAGIALEMFHQRVLSIPRSQDDLVLGQSQTQLGGPGLPLRPGAAPTGEVHRETDTVVKDWKGRLQMLLARRYRGVTFKITYDAPKSLDGIFSAFLMIIPTNVNDLDLKICYGKSSRVKKISEQSAAENAVKMLENDTLEVPSASTEKYRLSAINCNSNALEDIGTLENDKWAHMERIRRALDQRKPKRSVHPNSERNDSGAYFMLNSSFLFVKDTSMDGKIQMITDSISECALRHRKSTDRAVPLLTSDVVPDWAEQFVTRIVEKFHTQLESVCDVSESEPFKLTVQFGSAYFMNSEVTFDQKGVTVITVADIEGALHSSAKNRTTPERASFTLQPPQREPYSTAPGFIPSLILSPDVLNPPYYNNQITIDKRPSSDRADRDDRDDPDSYFPEPITQLRGMSNLGSRTSSGSFSGPSDLTAFQSANNIWPSAASGGSSGAADKEGEGDITLGPVDKEKKVDKRRRGISTGFRCSIFPLRIPSPSISNPNVSSIPTFSKPGTPLIEECFSEAELWLTPTLESMGYEEIDGMIDWPESVPGMRFNPLGPDCFWQVKVVASSAYQVDVRLTSELQVATVTERSLCWVNAMLIAGSPSPAVQAAATAAAATATTAAEEAVKKQLAQQGVFMSRDSSDSYLVDGKGSNAGYLNQSHCWEPDTAYRDSDYLESYPISNMSSNHSAAKRMDVYTPRVELNNSIYSKNRSSQSPYNSAYATPASSFSLSPSSLGPSTARSEGSYGGMRTVEPYYTGGQSTYSGSGTLEYSQVDNKPRMINLIPPTVPNPKKVHTLEEMKDVMLKGVDTRIKLSTAKSLVEGDPLYEAACPKGAAPIAFDKANQLPYPSMHLKSGHKVVFAKKLLQYKLFKHVHSIEVPTSNVSSTENAALDPFGDRRDAVKSRETGSGSSSGTATPIKNSNSNSNTTTTSTNTTITSTNTSNASNTNTSNASNTNTNTNYISSNKIITSNNTITNHNNTNVKSNININSNSSSINNSSDVICVNTVVVLSKYQQYEGDGLEDGGTLVDLSLEVDCSPLTQYLREKSLTEAHITRENIDIWLRSLFDHITQLCERLDRNRGPQAQH